MDSHPEQDGNDCSGKGRPHGMGEEARQAGTWRESLQGRELKRCLIGFGADINRGNRALLARMGGMDHRREKRQDQSEQSCTQPANNLTHSPRLHPGKSRVMSRVFSHQANPTNASHPIFERKTNREGARPRAQTRRPSRGRRVILRRRLRRLSSLYAAPKTDGMSQTTTQCGLRGG